MRSHIPFDRLEIHFFFLFTVLLATMSIITSVGAWYWLTDPKTAVVPLAESLINHFVFVIAAFILCEYKLPLFDILNL